jgi:hypothetical protein
MALRDSLRSGDVHVPGSRRYADPASFLLTPQQWEPQRREFLPPRRQARVRCRRTWPWRTTSCTRRCRTWRPSSPGAAGRARSGSPGTGVSHPVDRRGCPGRGRGAARGARRPAAPRPDRLGAGGDRRADRVHRPPGACALFRASYPGTPATSHVHRGVVVLAGVDQDDLRPSLLERVHHRLDLHVVRAGPRYADNSHGPGLTVSRRSGRTAPAGSRVHDANDG